VTCEALINQFLQDYVAGELPAVRAADFKLHLALCPPCRKYLASYRRTIQVAKAAEGAAGEPVPAELVAAILKVTSGK